MRYEIEGDVLTGIADAIREKTGKSALITPNEMADEIGDISGAVLQEKTVTENGVVLPDVGYDGLSSVVVEVQGGDKVLLMSQGQVSNTSRYMTAAFDSGIDLTQYDIIDVIMYENGSAVSSGPIRYISGSVTFYLYGDRDYRMTITATNISCNLYSGAYRNLYVDVYGINV